MLFKRARRFAPPVRRWLPSFVVADSITVTSPVQYKTFQRSGSTGAISISGTYTGSPTSIEASFNGGAYSTIVASPAGGTFSGTLSAQAQGQGTLTVRFTNATSVSATVADVGIGDVFVIAGDSIAVGQGTNAQSYTHATLKAAKFTQSDTWGEGNDGIDTNTNIGSHWPLLATQIMASQSVPVAFISVGTGSTDVYTSGNDEWAKNNSAYAEMTAQVTASGVNAVKAVLFHLGPNAVVAASTPSQVDYNAALDTLAGNVAADLAGAPKTNLALFGEVTTGSPPDRRAAIDNIRAAILEAWDDNSNIEPGPVLIDGDYSDGVHPKSDAELLQVAKRWWAALQDTYYSGSNGRGPRLSLAMWNVARDELTVTFDRTLKTGLTFGLGAWIVNDDGTPMTISGIAYHGTDPAAIVITTSAAASGASGTTTVTLASSNDAAGVVIPTSADISMATGAAIQLPAEPIYAAAVAESATAAISAAAGTSTASAIAGASTAASGISAAAGVSTAGTLAGVTGTGATIGTAAGAATASTIAGASTAAAAISAASGVSNAGALAGSAVGDSSAISPAAGVASAQIVVGASFAAASIGAATGASTCSALVGGGGLVILSAPPLGHGSTGRNRPRQLSTRTR